MTLEIKTETIKAVIGSIIGFTVLVMLTATAIGINALFVLEHKPGTFPRIVPRPATPIEPDPPRPRIFPRVRPRIGE